MNIHLSSSSSRCSLTASYDLFLVLFSRVSDQIYRASSFLLCMASPFLHKMLCGHFREGVTRRVSLADIDKKAFEKENCMEKEFREVMDMANLAG